MNLSRMECREGKKRETVFLILTRSSKFNQIKHEHVNQHGPRLSSWLSAGLGLRGYEMNTWQEAITQSWCFHSTGVFPLERYLQKRKISSTVSCAPISLHVSFGMLWSFV